MNPFFTRLFYRKPEQVFSFVAKQQNQPWWQSAVAVNILSFPRNTQRMTSFIKLSSINLRHWVMIKEGAPMNGVAVPNEIMDQALERGIYRFSCEEVRLRRQDREKWCRLKIPPSSP